MRWRAGSTARRATAGPEGTQGRSSATRSARCSHARTNARGPSSSPRGDCAEDGRAARRRRPARASTRTSNRAHEGSHQRETSAAMGGARARHEAEQRREEGEGRDRGNGQAWVVARRDDASLCYCRTAELPLHEAHVTLLVDRLVAAKDYRTLHAIECTFGSSTPVRFPSAIAPAIPRCASAPGRRLRRDRPRAAARRYGISRRRPTRTRASAARTCRSGPRRSRPTATSASSTDSSSRASAAAARASSSGGRHHYRRRVPSRRYYVTCSRRNSRRRALGELIAAAQVAHDELAKRGDHDTWEFEARAATTNRNARDESHVAEPPSAPPSAAKRARRRSSGTTPSGTTSGTGAHFGTGRARRRPTPTSRMTSSTRGVRRPRGVAPAETAAAREAHAASRRGRRDREGMRGFRRPAGRTKVSGTARDVPSDERRPLRPAARRGAAARPTRPGVEIPANEPRH